MECHDRSSRQPSLSPPSFEQGITASNGRTRTSAGGVAFNFSNDGDEKFEIMSAQLPDQKNPAAHLSWLFLEQMRSQAGTKESASRTVSSISPRSHRGNPGQRLFTGSLWRISSREILRPPFESPFPLENPPEAVLSHHLHSKILQRPSRGLQTDPGGFLAAANPSETTC